MTALEAMTEGIADPVSTRQTKGDRTRDRILAAAAERFAGSGYDGASIRDIEAAAGVNRGLVTHHFGNKEDLWKATFAYAFGPLLEDLRSKATVLYALDPVARRHYLLENFIRTNAEHHYRTQLMVQENFAPSWRSEWILEQFLAPTRDLMLEIGGDDPFLIAMGRSPHLRYAILGACNMVFSHRFEMNALFGEDVSDPDFVDRHVAAVLKMVDSLAALETAHDE